MHGFGFGVGSRTKRTDVHQCLKWLLEDLSRLTSGSYVHRRHAHILRREPSQLYVQVVSRGVHCVHFILRLDLALGTSIGFFFHQGQVVFLSENKLRDMIDWDEEEKRWMEDEPLSWRPKQSEA